MSREMVAKRTGMWLTWILVASYCVQAAWGGDGLQELAAKFPKQAVSGADFSLDHGRKYTVLVFLGVECPVARQYGSRLQPLAAEFEQLGVAFIGVNSNPQDSASEVAEYQQEMGIQFAVVKDSSQEVARHFQVTRTAEVVVIDVSGNVQYRGRIDNQFSPGVSRNAATQHDLRDALTSLVQGQPVAIRETTPVGCLITYRKSPDVASSYTFTRDIAPIFWQHCLECHRQGEIGPFDISNFEDLPGWGEMIVEVIDQQRMPPWHANPEHGTFKNARHLPEVDIEKIKSWVDVGMPYGEANALPEQPVFTSGWRLPRTPDLVVPMRDRPYRIPPQGTIDYQYFVVDPQLEEDRWITAAQIIPGAPSVVHHAIVFIRPPDGSEFRGIGWLTAYVPGQVATAFPPGFARKIPAGSKLVFQMHYTPNGEEAFDMTQIGLNFIPAEDVTHQVQTLIAIDQDFEIPPHANDHRVTAKLRQFPDDGMLLAVAPHMHLRGKSFAVTASRSQGVTTLLDVPRYDFNWQHTYEFSQPLPISQFQSIEIEAVFDNSAENPFNPEPSEYVMWGDQTWEEMAIAFFEVATPLYASVTKEEPAEVVSAESKREQFDAELDDFARQYAADFFKRHDANGDGQVTRDEVPRIIRDYSFYQLDKDGNGLLSQVEVEMVVRGRRGR